MEADESWWKFEVGIEVALGDGRKVSVSVGGSELLRRDLNGIDAAALGEQVRSAWAAEVNRVLKDTVQQAGAVDSPPTDVARNRGRR